MAVIYRTAYIYAYYSCYDYGVFFVCRDNRSCAVVVCGGGGRGAVRGVLILSRFFAASMGNFLVVTVNIFARCAY